MVQPALTENIKIGAETAVPTQMPQLQDVPVHALGCKKYCITYPIEPDDECLVVFGDMCIDSWCQSGGVQDSRRHDLSDAFAIVGFRSQPNVMEDYAADAIVIRNEDDDTRIALRVPNKTE